MRAAGKMSGLDKYLLVLLLVFPRQYSSVTATAFDQTTIDPRNSCAADRCDFLDMLISLTLREQYSDPKTIRHGINFIISTYILLKIPNVIGSIAFQKCLVQIQIFVIHIFTSQHNHIKNALNTPQKA
jgi:hypothetical protein